MTWLSSHDEELDVQNVSVISTELPDQELPTWPYSKYNVTVESITSMAANIMMQEKERDKRKLNLIIHNVIKLDRGQKTKKLCAELAELNKEGKRYRIKHGKIILREGNA